MSTLKNHHLPTSPEECRQRGWDEIDVVLVTGDAYVDHPSFGIALIGRLLEDQGLRVAVLAQPRHDTAEAFTLFGRPRLFFGISAGNLDSIVANYSGSGKVRDHDAYSPDGNPWFPGERSRKNRRRPDRATIVYANLARAAYADVPLVLGGIEASLRRFVHYDYKQQRLRGSVLSDAKADLLIYGMGERATLAAAAAYAAGRPATGIPGTCLRLSDSQFEEFRRHQLAEDLVVLPGLAEIRADPRQFMAAELLVDREARACSGKILVQRQESGWVVQHPAAAPLSEQELDRLHALPFQRTPHPGAGDIPAYRMIGHSLAIVRGCSGNCSFCAITRHQGPRTVSRSEESILAEIETVARMADFKGTVSDLGGPTANLWGTSCRIGGCDRHDCLYPSLCKNLLSDERRWLDLLARASACEGVRHLFISSGLRMELLLATPKLLARLLAEHTPGALKIAPEHTEDEVLRQMHKEPHAVLRRFVAACAGQTGKRGGRIMLTPYVITGHPGSSVASAARLVAKMKRLGLTVRQFQDFTPTPGTLSTAMFVSGVDPKGRPLAIPSPADRNRQRRLVEEGFLDRGGKREQSKRREHQRPKDGAAGKNNTRRKS